MDPSLACGVWCLGTTVGRNGSGSRDEARLGYGHECLEELGLNGGRVEAWVFSERQRAGRVGSW